MVAFGIVGVITYVGEQNKDGFFMFHLTTTKEKKTSENSVKEITVPFQGVSKLRVKLGKLLDGTIVRVYFDLTTKTAKHGEAIYVNLLALDVVDSST